MSKIILTLLFIENRMKYTRNSDTNKINENVKMFIQLLNNSLLLLLSVKVNKMILIPDPREINEILVSFSAWTNCRRLLVFKPNNADNISCLDGIRALAIFWVVVGHVFYITSYIPANPIYALQV